MAEIPIGQLARVAGATIDQTVRAIKIELFNGVIRDTRVDTGRARSNWMTTVGAPSSATRQNIDQSGSDALAEVAATVRADTVDWLSNNLPYIEKLEEMDAMVDRNVARLGRIVSEKTQ
jgi:hypothetical protein